MALEKLPIEFADDGEPLSIRENLVILAIGLTVLASVVGLLIATVWWLA